MWLWILKICANPLVRKILIYAGIGILAATVIGFSVYKYGTAQWKKGEQQGRIAGALDLEEAHKAEWEAQRSKLAADSELLAHDTEILQTQRREIERSRAMLNSNLQQTLKRIESAKVNSDATIIAIPADMLDSALRDLSAELATPAH